MKKSEEIKKNCEKMNANKEKEIARLEGLIKNATASIDKAKEKLLTATENEDAAAYEKADAELKKNEILKEMYAGKIESVKSTPVLDDATYKEYVNTLYGDTKELYAKYYSGIRNKLESIETDIRTLLDERQENIFTLAYIQRVYNYKDCQGNTQRGLLFLGREKPGDTFIDFYLADIVRGIQNLTEWLSKNGVK